MVAPDWGLLLTALLASLPVTLTPGPNNVILAAIGATSGFRRALPYALGVILGFPIALGIIGFGLDNIFRLYPQLQDGARIIGGLFLVFLAWRIAVAPLRDIAAETKQNRRVPGFFQSMLFQWINPKGLSYMFSLIAVYTRPAAVLTDTLMLMALTCLLSVVSTMIWIFAGILISRWLGTTFRQRLFNRVMGLLLLFVATEIVFR